MWRNDVKDFISGNISDNIYECLEIKFAIKDTEIFITGKVKKPYLIFGITFILLPQKYKNLKSKRAIHPITKKEIPIFISDVKEPHFGIPAHNDKDFDFAIKNNLPIRQIVMPVNASLDENRPRNDKKWVYRQNVVLIVKHWSEDKYLYIEYKKHNWKCFISGGIEDGETPHTAAIRELKEESGFYNIKSIKQMPFKMANVFYAAT